jgi:hypothetical protein
MVAEADLTVRAPSFFAYSSIDPARNQLLDLLLANVVTGCTTVVNRPLLDRARPFPREAMMYDHWLALVAVATGAIGYVDQATMLYRQHPGNAIGARRRGLLRRIYRTLMTRDAERVLTGYSRQAAVLLARFGDVLDPRERTATKTLAGIWELSPLQRFIKLREAGLGLGGFARNVALLIVLVRGGGRLERRRRARHRDAVTGGREAAKPRG